MSKVEEVARAIYEDRNGHGCKPWGHLTKSHRFPYLADAIAAIKAMREPTNAMFDAAEPFGICMSALDDAYQAMVDAALREEGR